MKKHYLIRRSLEQYIGPLNLDGLRRSFRKMEFGLQDEVAASLGPWVHLEDMDRLKRHYPEVAKLVGKEFLSDWGVSEHTQVNISSKNKKNSSRSSIKGILLGIGVSLLAFGIVHVVLENYPLESKDPSVMVQGLVRLIREDPHSLQQQLKQNKDHIRAQALKSKENYQIWLPLIRYLAFEMFEPQLADGLLRSVGGYDCRVEAIALSLKSVDDFKRLAGIKNRMLLWDPNWIRRRSEFNQSSRNDFEGCLRVVRHTLHSNPDFAAKDYDVYKSRVQYQLEMIQRGQSQSRMDQGVFATMQCIELNQQRCLDTTDQIEGDLQSWLKVYETRSRIATLIARKDQLAEAELAEISRLMERLSSVDTLTRLDYSLENEFASLLIEFKGDTKKVRDHYAQTQRFFNP
jgi:hypothetical protein